MCKSLLNKCSLSVNFLLLSMLYYLTGTTLFESYQLEVMYVAPRSTANFCLFGNGGPTFLNALEFRKLAPRMYATVLGPTLDTYLFTLLRINCGPPEDLDSTQFWRYENPDSCLPPHFGLLPYFTSVIVLPCWWISKSFQDSYKLPLYTWSECFNRTGL